MAATSASMRAAAVKRRGCSRELLDLEQASYVAPMAIAVVHLGLGQFGEAMNWLEKGIRHWRTCAYYRRLSTDTRRGK
jgi:hypothetical protein